MDAPCRDSLDRENEVRHRDNPSGPVLRPRGHRSLASAWRAARCIPSAARPDRRRSPSVRRTATSAPPRTPPGTVAEERNAPIQSSPAGETSSRMRASVSIPRSPTSTTRLRPKPSALVHSRTPPPPPIARTTGPDCGRTVQHPYRRAVQRNWTRSPLASWRASRPGCRGPSLRPAPGPRPAWSPDAGSAPRRRPTRPRGQRCYRKFFKESCVCAFSDLIASAPAPWQRLQVHSDRKKGLVQLRVIR